MEDAVLTGEVSDAVLKIKSAFEVFDSQSALLQSSYEDLKTNLAKSHMELNFKNMELSEKVLELREMSSRLQCILESLTDGVLVVDDNLRVERCNPAAEALLGLPREKIEGRLYEEIMNGLGNVARLNSAMKSNNSFLDDQRVHVDADGVEVVVLASAAPIQSQNGEVIGVVEVLRDVTELRMLEEKVNCQKRMAALGEMAASVAHEIRNPLGTIEGFARLLKRDLEDQPDHLRLASKIVEGAQNLNYVITNLLTYARPMNLNNESFAVTRLLSEVRDLMVDRASRAGVRVAVNETTEPLSCEGDICQLRHVLVNLGMNAIEACSEGGHVSISSFRRSGRSVFSVTDDGLGMSKGDLQRIFDPFFTKKQGGTGLGLSLCHKIVSAHGGEIQVASEPGCGSVFEVILPTKRGML